MQAPEQIRRHVTTGIIQPVAEMITGHRSPQQLRRKLSRAIRLQLRHTTLRPRPRPQTLHADVLVYPGRLETSAVLTTPDNRIHPLAVAIDHHHGRERIVAIESPWLQVGDNRTAVT